MTTALNTEIPFVDDDKAAEFPVITCRQMLEGARAGEIPVHAMGEGKRKMSRFRLSEPAKAVGAKKAANACLMSNRKTVV